MSKKYNSINDLVSDSANAIGHSFKEYDINNRLQNYSNKGNLGQVMEEGFYGYNINSNQEADFADLGVELKVTPYKRVNKGKQISAKERLVLTMINYMEDYNIEFQKSHCYEKLSKILMMFYEHEPNKYKYDYIISKVFLYQFDLLSPSDQQIIINDYENILTKIKNGQAHLISESDTFYLGACTKGSTKASSMTSQPFCDIEAPSRAFSLKASYMTTLLRSSFFEENAITNANLIDDVSLLKERTLGDIIVDYFKKYEGMALEEIEYKTNKTINKNNKSYLRSYASAMLNSKLENPDELNEFKKANIQIKTIRINKKGKIKESMSFPAIKFSELVTEEWDSSSLRDTFINTKFLFCIFDEIDDKAKSYRFRKAFLWSMPEVLLDDTIKYVWEDTKEKALGSLVLTPNDNNGKITVSNNFIKKEDEKIIHVRPHAAKRIYVFNDGTTIGDGNISTDGDRLPDGTIITKQCFFINNSFILSQIEQQ